MATITPIAGSDLMKDSRAVINTNFTNLNTDKAETNSPTLITPKIAGSSTGSTAIASANASATNYTIIFKAEDGTVALMSDITGGWFWTAVAGTPTRTSNTTFTVTGDYTAIFAKWLVIKWTESGTVRNAMVAIPSTYSAPDTTITIVWDIMASLDDSSLKYAFVCEQYIEKFAVAGSIGATGTDVANAFYAREPMRVLGSDLSVGTAGTTNNTTVDINKNWTTMFTTKPTLATTVASSPLTFTADTATSLALGDKITLDVDAIQTTSAVDLYVQIYLFPTRLNNLS